MITTLRHFLVDSWLGRAVAFVVFLAFIGLGGTFMGLGGGGGLLSDDGVVKVGGRTITPQELENAIHQQIYFLQNNGVPSVAFQDPSIQRRVAHAALRNLIVAREAALAAERNGIMISDDMIRQHVFSMPDFLDAKGQFDVAKMDSLLQRSHLDHAFLIDQTRRLLLSEATLFGLGQSVKAPSALTDHLVHFYTRIRVADLLAVPFSMGASPNTPSEAQLHRFYDNHPWMFRESEFRHARIVVMTPESVARTIVVPENVLKALYKERERAYNLPETRSFQTMGFDNETDARKAQQLWRSGMTWAMLKVQFPKAIPAELMDARQSDVPDAALGKAVFVTPAGKVTGPVKTQSGWNVVRVLGVKPPHVVSFEQARNAIRKEVQDSQGAAALQARLKSFQDAVAGSTTLDKIPADLGAVPASGSLNSEGRTADHEPAPIPGNAAMRQAIIRQIFAQEKGALPHVVVLPDGGAFAVVVDEVHPGRRKSFDEAHTQILLAWQAEQKKRDVNTRVTALYQKAKASSLRAVVVDSPDAIRLRKDEAFSLLHPRQDMSESITQAVLHQPLGQTIMIQDGQAFWLVSVTAEHSASEQDEQALHQRIAAQQEQGIQNDVTETLGMAYMREVMPRRFNPSLFNQVTTIVFRNMVPAAGQGSGSK